MRYANIIYNDLVNTDGVALSVFTQGCFHGCKDCFSKSTWDVKGGKEWTEKEEQAIKYVLENYPYDNICLLGGEPLINLDLCERVLSYKLKHHKVWAYTGFIYEELSSEQLDFVTNNVNVLIDGKFEQDLACPLTPFKGSSNQRIFYL